MIGNIVNRWSKYLFLLFHPNDQSLPTHKIDAIDKMLINYLSLLYQVELNFELLTSSIICTFLFYFSEYSIKTFFSVPITVVVHLPMAYVKSQSKCKTNWQSILISMELKYFSCHSFSSVEVYHLALSFFVFWHFAVYSI